MTTHTGPEGTSPQGSSPKDGNDDGLRRGGAMSHKQPADPTETVTDPTDEVTEATGKPGPVRK